MAAEKSSSCKSAPEPAWVSLMPSASGLWSMILTFRERGSNDVADNLQAAAEKQWEVHLRTQKIMNRSQKQVQIHTPKLARSSTGGIRNNTISENQNHLVKERKKENFLSVSSCIGSQDERVLNEKRTESTLIIPARVEPPTTISATSSRSLSPIESSTGVTLIKNKNFHGYYNHYSSRLKSYEMSKFRWVSPSPSQLSEAGFFFIGPKDKVKCFACEICQNEWKSCECNFVKDPWVRHTRHSPLCDYIIEARGQDFISSILGKVEKVKNGIINTYSRSNSNNSAKNVDSSELGKMKLRSTKKTTTMSGWQLDPYKEKVVGKKKK